VKKLAIAVALCVSLIGSPVQAKTFVGVLWPMFGPLPAFGLAELVAELKTMPDVEVTTYLHQSWPSLVEDIEHQPPGTHTIVVGYSLGANATAFVANKTKYIDLIVALQPSMLSWNPPITGKVGRMIEIYNPNPWMTFGGMGSKKLVGPNIEYIANNDSHPGAQFNSGFRSLVKTEITKFTAGDRVEIAQAAVPKSIQPKSMQPTSIQLAQAGAVKPAPQRTADQRGNAPAADRRQVAQAEIPAPATASQATTLARPSRAPRELVAFLDTLSSAVDSGDLSTARDLTPADLLDYAKRTHGAAPTPADRPMQTSRL
jgi:hypothetical protein